ncbi:flavodoxin domain-containing protein [Candidatus Uabimicrobium amorphum]|uniref:Flavodoxin n=1 Tax=Uabimicrobium amorphum TaxID=2596890 RepID=A0A5S9ILT9_UABAM|nr:flavodoxin domain-containing protein [Candidatus Uabimicrobium amorphum]BBM83806.1 flavodoxin [Candidatus Uabimicrobium amorphum]
MDKFIGIFYATGAGNTKTVAEEIQKELGEDRTDIFDIFHIKKKDYSIFDEYDFLIFGSPTYTGGTMHFRWKSVFPFLKKLDFSERYVALFTLGDRKNYPKKFALALNQMHNELKNCYDIAFLGECTPEDYHYTKSAFLGQKKIHGLAIDQHNEKNLTPQRIQTWVNHLREYIDDW